MSTETGGGQYHPKEFVAKVKTLMCATVVRNLLHNFLTKLAMLQRKTYGIKVTTRVKGAAFGVAVCLLRRLLSLAELSDETAASPTICKWCISGS